MGRCPFLALFSVSGVSGGADAGGSNKLTSADRYAGERCAYRMTMRRPRWPGSSATDRSEAPFMISHDAKVCRRSCHVKSLILAISSAVWNPFFTSFTGSPTLAACRVGEYVGAIGRTFGVERLQCRQHRRIQRDGVG